MFWNTGFWDCWVWKFSQIFNSITIWTLNTTCTSSKMPIFRVLREKGKLFSVSKMRRTWILSEIKKNRIFPVDLIWNRTMYWRSSVYLNPKTSSNFDYLFNWQNFNFVEWKIWIRNFKWSWKQNLTVVWNQRPQKNPM